jgi:hypothetical protein
MLIKCWLLVLPDKKTKITCSRLTKHEACSEAGFIDWINWDTIPASLFLCACAWKHWDCCFGRPCISRFQWQYSGSKYYYIVFFLMMLQVGMFSLPLRCKLCCLRVFSTEGSGSAMLPNAAAFNCNQLDISGFSTAWRYFKELESR